MKERRLIPVRDRALCRKDRRRGPAPIPKRSGARRTGFLIGLIAATGIVPLIMASCSSSTTTGPNPVTVENYHINTGYRVPPNPVLNTSTPSQYDYAVFTRYYEKPEPKQIRAVLVLIPGFYGGAGGFDKMAKTIVQMSGGQIEVWAVDRRSVMIDDLTGLQEAMRERNPSIAFDYYFSGATIDGKTYAGPPTSSSLSYMSEWGLDMTMKDLNTIISLIPQPYRKTNVFLGGHSLGSWLVQDYAAYDFDGNPSTLSDAGYNQIAGIIQLDGGGTGLFPSLTEAQYLSGTTGNSITLSGLSFSFPGIDQLRQTPADVIPAGVIAGLGPEIIKVFTFIQIEGIYAELDPNALSPLLQNSDFQLIATLLLGNIQLKATNEAMLGFTMDRHFDPIGLMTGTLGIANGPLAPFPSAISPGETMSQPTDHGSMVYTWNSDGHITNIKDVEAALSNTYTTITEWYFPMRLAIDAMAFGDSYAVGTTDWQWDEGLHVTHTSQMDAPVLVFGGESGLEQTDTVFYKYRDLLPPARGCAGQPRSACGFDIHMMPNYTHMDILLSDPAVAPDGVDATIYRWIIAHTVSATSMPAPVLP